MLNYDKRQVFVDIPSKTGKMKQKEFEQYNNLILDAVLTVCRNGQTSKLDRINADRVIDEKAKYFFNQSLKALDKNPQANKTDSVHLNLILFGQFLTEGVGIPLVKQLYAENKMLNWPYIFGLLTNPNYDFANSNLLVDLSNEAKRIKINTNNNTYGN